MLISIHYIFWTIFIFFSLPLFSFAEKASIPLLREEINTILDNSCLKDGSAGIKVFSLTRGDILYQLNSDRFFVPASNVKLLTSAVALKELGGEYQFLTTVSTDGKIKNGVLYGNLYLKGYGDPRLVSEELWMISKDIRNIGIKSVNGNIIADDSFFDKIHSGVGVIKNAGPEPYNAKISALSLNFNTVTVYVYPSEKEGDTPLVIIDPPTKYIKISNEAKTTFKRKHKKLVVGRVTGKEYDTVVVKGSINNESYNVYLGISKPTLYTVTVFKEFLEKEGIKISGSVSIAKQPENLKELVLHKSRPLALIIQDMNKISNNFISEQVLKTAGAERFGTPGTTQKGLDLISQLMETLGYPPSSYSLVDGSGLSKRNSLSPDQIVDVLKNMYYDFSVRAEYISSLGIMGIDGSLKERLKELTKKKYVRAKTGTLNGASSLSGYIGAAGREDLAFSILVNSSECSKHNILKIQDEVVKKLVGFFRIETGKKILINAIEKRPSISPQLSYTGLQ